MNELDWVEFLKRRFKEIGDDCGVVKKGDWFYLFTNDLFVENIHFKKGKITLKNLGRRAIARAISDIVACGGVPEFVSISIGISKDFRGKALKKIVEGIYNFCKEYKLKVVGGDTSSSPFFFLDVFCLGKAKKVVLRSKAKEEDYIFLSGPLGRLKFSQVPYIRVREVQSLLKKYKVNAMIDISDGFFLDMYRLLKESRKGVLIYRENLPIRRWRELLRGEDYELIFVVDKSEDIERLKKKYFLVGRIKNEKFGYKIKKKDTIEDIPLEGYLHF
ncbi:MAG: hypothetical protein B6D56_00705 [Candidatus Omnitrophica bacterium 4484_70.1]|nr:MAG: hypothetical protein B6D56_00705 [Candidatus Omnitrophica bacterium 4484_70.1]